MPEKTKTIFEPVDITSTIVLILAVAFFFYFAMARNAEKSKRHFRSLVKDMEAELTTIKNAREEIRTLDLKGSASQKTSAITDVPAFLEKLNRELKASGLELDNINKSLEDEYSYKLVAYAPFDRLLDFLERTEQSNLAIQNLSIHPYSMEKYLIKIDLRVIKDKMSPEDLQNFKDFQKGFSTALRDPFQKYAAAAKPVKGASGVINLTWKYKLSGIGFDKKRYATIDHNNYYKGDMFNGMLIVRITNNSVSLQSGSAKYYITFRYRSGGTGR